MGDLSRRSIIKNYLLSPIFQWRKSLILLAICMAPLVISGFLIDNHISKIKKSTVTVNQTEMDIYEDVEQIRGSIFIILISVGILSLGFYCSTVVIITHRVFGSSYALVQFIEQIREGVYEPKRKLRKNDELHEVMDALHRLAKDLEKNQVGPTTH